MDRKILFRGKRIDNSEWVHGSFCMDALEQFNGLCGVDGFIRLYDKDSGKMQMYEVDRETVGQYTGLTDKNSKKIFEGDIFSVTWKAEGRTPVVKSFVVEFKNGCFYARTFNGNTIVATVSNYAKCGKVGNTGVFVEVIGNIHDNPELLEGGVENAAD